MLQGPVKACADLGAVRLSYVDAHGMQDIPTFARPEVGCTLDPGHALGCSE
jgi:hypothetical protein